MNKPYTPWLCVLALLGLLCLGSCSKSYDDSALKESIGKVEQRAGSLDALITRANTNIQALQAMAQSMAGQDYLESYSQDSGTGAITLKFAKAGSITLAQGTNGQNGVAPSMSIAKAEDGKYYWRVGESWLLDRGGQRVATVPENGITPRLKIEGGMWYISYDEGRSWEPRSLGKAIGERGVTGAVGPTGPAGSSSSATATTPSLIQSIDDSSSATIVKITLTNGQVLEIPRDRDDIVIEVVGNVPEALVFGDRERGILMTQRIKLRVGLPKDKEPKLWIATRTIGNLTSTLPEGAKSKREEGDRVWFEWTERMSAYDQTPFVSHEDAQLGALIVEIIDYTVFNFGSLDAPRIKMKVIPIKYRKVDVIPSRHLYIDIAAEGETITVPTHIRQSQVPYTVIFPKDTPFTFRHEGDNIIIQAQPNTRAEEIYIPDPIEVLLYPLGKEPHHYKTVFLSLHLKQKSLTKGYDSFEVNLGTGRTVLSQLTDAGYTPSTNIGVLRLKGTPSASDQESFTSFLRNHLGQLWTLDMSLMQVTSLEMGWLNGPKRYYKRVILPNSLKTLTRSMMRALTFLELILPEGLETIQRGAFDNAQVQLGDLRIPNSVTSLETGAFQASDILRVVLSDALSEIPKGAFKDSRLLRITLPKGSSFNKIDDEAFRDCTNLEKIYCYQHTPPTLGRNVFVNRSGFVRVYIPKGSKSNYMSSQWAQYFKASDFVELERMPSTQEFLWDHASDTIF